MELKVGQMIKVNRSPAEVIGKQIYHTHIEYQIEMAGKRYWLEEVKYGWRLWKETRPRGATKSAISSIVARAGRGENLLGLTIEGLIVKEKTVDPVESVEGEVEGVVIGDKASFIEGDLKKPKRGFKYFAIEVWEAGTEDEEVNYYQGKEVVVS